MKKLLLFLIISTLSLCFFAIGVSATEYTPSFGEVTIIEGMAEDSAFGDDGKATTFTSRVYMSDGRTYPTYYILNNTETLQVNFSELNSKTADIRAEGFSYDRNTVICLEVCEGVTTFPNCFAATGSAIFWGDRYTSTIEYLKTPSTLTSLSTDATIFSMKALRCVDFSLSKFTELPSRGLQSASALTEVYFPSTLTTLGSDSMNGCSSLKTVDFSNTQLEVVGYRSMFSCTALEMVNLGTNLKKMETQCFYQAGTSSDKSVVIYKIPSTFNEIYNQFGTIWQSSKTPVIYYTGTLDDTGMTAIKTGGGISWNTVDSCADDYDANAVYSKASIVYNLNLCDVFFGSHQMTGEERVNVTSYFEEIAIGDICTRNGCGKGVVSKTIAPIFIDYGYSATEGDINGTFAMSQFYGINQEALDAYKTATGKTFEYGLLAAADSDPITNLENGTLDSKKVFVTNADSIALSCFGMRVCGITEEKSDAKIAFCAYIKDGDKLFYLDDGMTVTSVTMKSYNEIMADIG